MNVKIFKVSNWGARTQFVQKMKYFGKICQTWVVGMNPY